MRNLLLLIIIILLSGQIYSAVLFKTHNKVLLMEPNSVNWKEVKDGYTIINKSQIKVDDKSCAMIVENNIRITLREDTIIKINKVNNLFQIEILSGAVLINSKTAVSNLVVKSLIASLDIKSRQCLVKNIRNNLSVSVFDNETIANVKGAKISVKQGFGLEITPKFENLEPFPLPDSPIPEFPIDKSIISAGVNLKWSKVTGAFLYRIEIAKDKKFVNVIVRNEINTNTYPTIKLEDGQHFWRISSINRKNIESVFFDEYYFIVQGGGKDTLLISGKADDVKPKEEEVPKEEDDGDAEMGEDEDYVPQENTTNSIILGGIILLSVVILIIL